MNQETRKKIIVVIDRTIESLIPGYLSNRQKDIKELTVAIEYKDFKTIQVIGHKMKGTGLNYGFKDISDIGLVIETAAKEKSLEKIKVELENLKEYLEVIEITYEK